MKLSGIDYWLACAAIFFLRHKDRRQ